VKGVKRFLVRPQASAQINAAIQYYAATMQTPSAAKGLVDELQRAYQLIRRNPEAARRALRSAEPMAARKQREHEWIAQAVHAEGHGHLRVLTASTQRDRETIEREAAQDARLPYTR
jgi:plasmid stabilization system protein ParE